jgi:hypothetical protein
MLAIMFWGDDEEKKKARIEGNLRHKREGRGGARPKPPSPPAAVSTGDSAAREELARQTAVISEKQEELKHLMVQQNKVLQLILEKQDKPVYEVFNPPSTEQLSKREPDLGLPTLQELDVKVISTEGIEIQGEVGEEKKEGQSIRSSAARLREIKQRGKR